MGDVDLDPLTLHDRRPEQIEALAMFADVIARLDRIEVALRSEKTRRCRRVDRHRP